MFFDFSIIVPFDTRESDPLEEVLKLSAGVIHHVEIGFPWGCAGLVFVQLDHMDHQLWPLNPGGRFNSDDEVIAWEDRYELVMPYNWLRARFWNLDDTFDHTIELRFGILSKGELEAGTRIMSALQSLIKALGI